MNIWEMAVEHFQPSVLKYLLDSTKLGNSTLNTVRNTIFDGYNQCGSDSLRM